MKRSWSHFGLNRNILSIIAAGAAVGIFAIVAVPLLDTTNAESEPVVVAAAGDISCKPAQNAKFSEIKCRGWLVSQMIAAAEPDFVWPLGDLQYPSGEYANFLNKNGYDGLWGQFNPIARPVPGNHEYQTTGAGGYYRYFRENNVPAAGVNGKGYYSYSTDDWLILAINSECNKVGGCGVKSSMYKWAKAELENPAYAGKCAIAYWHRARWSQGDHGNVPSLHDLWNLMVDKQVAAVVSAHNHLYARSYPIGKGAAANAAAPEVYAPYDPAGLLQFIAGSGGAALDSKTDESYQPAPFEEIRNNTTHGFLKLTLKQGSYDYEYVNQPITGASAITDAGTRACTPL